MKQDIKYNIIILLIYIIGLLTGFLAGDLYGDRVFAREEILKVK